MPRCRLVFPPTVKCVLCCLPFCPGQLCSPLTTFLSYQLEADGNLSWWWRVCWKGFRVVVAAAFRHSKLSVFFRSPSSLSQLQWVGRGAEDGHQWHGSDKDLLMGNNAARWTGMLVWRQQVATTQPHCPCLPLMQLDVFYTEVASVSFHISLFPCPNFTNRWFGHFG